MKRRAAILALLALVMSGPAKALTCAVSQFDTNAGVTCNAQPIPPQKSYVYPPTGSAATGFATTVPDGVTIWILNSSALLASGSVTLPANPGDGMPLSLECPKGVTVFTVAANAGQTLSNVNISACAAGTPYRLKYSGINSTWYPN